MTYTLPLQQFAERLRQHPERVWLHQPVEQRWQTLTWADVDDQARRIATGLQAQGWEPGSRIAILSKNCAQWFILDLAIMMAGMVSVPIYATAGRKTIAYCLQHSACKAVFVGKLDSTAAAQEAIGAEVMRIALPYPTVEATQHWADWLQRYAPLQQIAHPQSADTMTICYTSGSTGVPKGVVLSYLNIASSAQCTVNRSDVRPQDRMLSYLPLAHITERAVVEMVSIWNGVEVYFVESMETFAADLRHARPTGFVSVPRLWTIFQAQILQGIPNATLQRLLRIPLLNKLVARRIRKAMGIDKARRFGSGTAPISPAVLEWFQRIGVPIGEGWGMTETAGLACGNVPFQARHLGTIGLPVDCVEMRLGEHGELLVRGDSVFKEYYLNPEATAAAFSDGWFHTGDRAIALEDGAWKIVGRLKEQFKTAKGKYVAPVPIESLVASDPLVEQVCVMGSGRKQPVAFVVLNNSAGSDREAIRQRLNGLLGQVNSQLESHECLDHIVVCADGWSVENELLTPTMKLKRDQIETRYARLLEPLAGSDTILWEDGIT